jgi:hypothetical protein
MRVSLSLRREGLKCEYESDMNCKDVIVCEAKLFPRYIMENLLENPQ